MSSEEKEKEEDYVLVHLPSLKYNVALMILSLAAFMTVCLIVFWILIN